MTRGHTFSYEGEHEHAILAYSTAARLFTGSHLPLLCVAMEHLQLSNHLLAEENLAGAALLCDSDPLLFNERGVLAYAKQE